MVRPTSKNDLIESSEEQYNKLISLLNSLSDEELNLPFSFDLDKEKGAHWKRDKNIHDVLIHLHEWHKLLLNWVASNQNGNEEQFLKKGYNWRTYGEMNEEFTKENKDSTYEKAFAEFKGSHKKIMELLDNFSDKELFTKNEIPWSGGSTLGSYFISVTSSHYEWASKKIRKFKKFLN